MPFWSDCRQTLHKHVAVAAAALTLLAVVGCQSGPSQKNAGQKSGGQPNSAVNARGGDAGIDLNCVMDHIQKPPEAFHYSYNKTSGTPVHEEADITPQTIDGTFSVNGAQGTVHGVSSDAESWKGAWGSLRGVGGMASAVAIVNHSSATVREKPESMNGYQTVKYSIDTARGNSSEQGLYKSVLGEGGFEKGEAWVTAEGCPVKFTLDSELHGKDGSVEPIHYQLDMVKK